MGLCQICGVGFERISCAAFAYLAGFARRAGVAALREGPVEMAIYLRKSKGGIGVKGMRRVVGVLLAAVMVIGLVPGTAWAAENKLSPPQNAHWATDDEGNGYPGWFYWEPSVSDTGESDLEYDISVYNGSEEVYHVGWSARGTTEAFLVDSFLWEPHESGQYRFSVQLIDWDDETRSSDPVWSDTWIYNNPGAYLSAPNSLSAEGNTLIWHNDSGSDSQDIEWYFSAEENSQNQGGGSYAGSKNNSADLSKITRNFRYGDGYYHVRVRNLSRDITTICPSDWSDYLTLHVVDGTAEATDSAGTIVLSENLTLTNVSYSYEEGEDGYNSGSVGSQEIIFTVTGPSNVTDVRIAGWTYDQPTAAEAQESAESWSAVWKKNGDVLSANTPPFWSGSIHPVYADDLGKTVYVTLAGLDTDLNLVGYTVVKTDMPGAAFGGGGGGTASTIIASGDCGAQGNNLTWTLNSDGLLTISGTGAMTDFRYDADVPWNNYASEINTVMITGGVTSIGNYAFAYCNSLASVSIPNSVKTIGRAAFCGCRSLPGVSIPDGVMSIGDSAFFACDELTVVSIPDSVMSIGDSAFWYCTSLESVQIGPGVTSIGDFAFSACSSLTDINVSEGNASYASIDGILYDKNKTKLISCPSGKSGSVVILDTVTSIEARAFYDCSHLTAVTISDSVKTIEDGAFQGCSSLESMTIPDSVTTIGNYVFNSCTNLAELRIGKGVTTIGVSEGEFGEGGIFYYCTSLTRIDVDADNANYSSENGVLYNKNKSSLIAWPPGKGGVATIPDSVKSIGVNSFGGCYKIVSVSIPDSVTAIGAYAFNHCGMTSLKIGNGVTSIEDCTFCGCFNLTKISFGSSVISIGRHAFESCNGLTAVAIPDSVTTISSSAFDHCTSLVMVSIPQSVTSIKYGAFSDCPKLSDVYYSGTEAQWHGIEIDNNYNYNDSILNANIHFNSSLPPVTVLDEGTRADPVTKEEIQYEVWSDDSVAVFGDVSMENPVLVANYDKNGRMTGLTRLIKPGAVDLSGGDTAKLFWLSESSVPKCDCVPIG